MEALGVVDWGFLSLEKRRQPMHVGMLFLFQIPDNSPEDYVYQFVQALRQSDADVVKPFNRVLKGLFWEKDDDFELEQHFRHIALTKPGRIRELLAYVSQEHGVLMDRAKPLWECHVIEGIEASSDTGGRRFAMYCKIHHGLVDGVAGMRLLQKSFSPDPTVTMPPIWAVPNKKSKKPSDGLVKKSTSVLSTLQDQIKTIPTVSRELFRAIGETRSNPDYVSVFQAPTSILNQTVTASRRFAAQSYDLPRLQGIAKAFHVTLNDIILAICSGALRSYLMTLNALPKKPLIAMVPISLRTDESISGNQISMILANLATHKSDPLERLQMIARSVNNAKARFGRMTQAEIMNYSGVVYSVAGANLATGWLPKHQAFNIVISNVPGPKEMLYWNGARLDALYPLSIVLDGQAMNMTLTSYQSKLEVGITACRKTLPKIQNLLGLLEDEIHALEMLSKKLVPLHVASVAKPATRTPRAKKAT